MEESEEEHPKVVFDSQSQERLQDNDTSNGPMNISEIVDTSIKSYRGEKVRRTRMGRKNKESK